MSRSSLVPLLAALVMTGSGLAAWAEEPLRAQVHPRRNVEDFAPIEANLVRFSIAATTRGEPCLDELEIYGPDDPTKNLALADTGARVRASGTLADYGIHALHHLNDGRYGNAHSWIGSSVNGWVEVELPQPTRIHRIVWSRDRLGKFIDRLVTDYRIETALGDGEWQLAAAASTRRPLELPGTVYPNFRAGKEGLPPGGGEAAGPSGAAAREYVLTTWRREQGLPANSVTALLQAPDHWLWVGTANGLVRFDGLQFSAAGTSALKGLRVSCLHADHRGQLWAGTDGGGLFRQEDAVFMPVPAGAGLPEKTVLALASDAGGTLWAGGPGGLYAFRDGKFTREAGGAVPRLVRDHSGDGLWLLRGSTLLRWSGGALGPPGTALEPSHFGSLAALAADPRGAVWFGGANEYLATLQDGSVATFAHGHSLFTTTLQEILPAANGEVWLGTAGSGLAKMSAGGLLMFGPEDGLSSNSFAALAEDTGGNLWAGGDDGLTRISLRRCAAVTLNDGLSQSVVMSLAEDAGGRIWLGTNGGGLNRLQGGKAVPYTPSYLLDNEVIPALLAARDGTVWAGTLQSGLARMEGDNITFLTTQDGLPENAVTALCEDRSGGLWAGSPSGGLALVKDGRVSQPPAAAPLKGDRINALTVDGKGRLWIGTASQGVAMLDGENLKRWTTAQGLAGNAVHTLHLDASGTLWAGTSAGLCRWRGAEIESFNETHGLPDEMIWQITGDGAGQLWLGTNRGVVRVPLASFDDVSTGRATRLDILQLDRSDGLPSMECTRGSQHACLQLRDGRLGFGTVAGLAMVDPARFSIPPMVPPIFIEVVESASRAASSPRTPNPESRGSSASFRFTALAYSTPQRLRFRYRLHGLDANWTEAGSQRSASYEFLPPGNFRFEAQASLEGGPWAGKEVTFQIPAPWWRTPWAIGAAIFCGAMGLASVVRLTTRRRLKRRLQEVEQKLVLERERSRIARDIHDQLGANLTHIALLSAGSHRDLPAPARERFLAIAASSNELVQAMDAIVWAVNPVHGSVESLARYLSRFAHEFLSAACLRLRLDVPLELPDAGLSPEVRHSLFLAVREVLNNAVRHAAAATVHLSLEVSANTLAVVIADDGSGFDPSGATDGDGLENLHRRLRECGGACAISSAPGHGTRVTLSLPLAT